MSNNHSYFQYDNHSAEWERVLHDPDYQKMGQTWLRTDTLDAWRHARMREPLRAIIQNDPQANWLTIGDGRFGTDAHYLLASGVKEVHCSDVSDALLKIGHEKGFIKEFSAQNAEDLTFPDNTFDYVYCKEAFHHFPRPYIALYEMFRVAKKAVFLIEPRDTFIDQTPLGAIIYGFKKIFLRKKDPAPAFEAVGNFVYAISEKELEKFLLGMHYTYIAFTGCNDEYIDGVEYVAENPVDVAGVKIKSRVLKKIRKMNFYCKIGTQKTGVLTAALFKEPPTQHMIDNMEKLGWRVKRLASNPYL
ncbi:methyltransferase domain-containing protein [Polynucleobacter sp. MWH-UH23A]|uniref:class I SAM-dependent methyltransferase n=1 Tax=Polynucleobacter sp. MWH-UH23A TaxID=1855613 RepID=UPI003364F119